MKRRPPRSTSTGTPFPDTTLFRSEAGREITGDPVDERRRHALPATPRRPVGERRAALAVTEGRNGEQLLLHGAHLLHHARIEVEASRLTIFLPTGRPAGQVGLPRPEAVRVGNECVITFKSRWTPNNK